MVDLSIVIVNYKVPHLVEQCLYSVYRSTGSLSTEIWVVDNHSEDGSIERIRTHFPEVNYIANSENLGFARANNIAIQKASGRYILLLNPDTVMAENTLFDCFCRMEENPSWGGLGVKMLNARGEFLQESKRGLPTPWVAICKMLSLYRLAPRSRWLNRYYWGHTSPDEIAIVEVLSGAFMFLRGDMLKKLGGLDEAFFMYGEDIDLSYRITQSGYALAYYPTPILHYKGESEHASHNRKRYIESFYGAMGIFYRKHASARSVGGRIVLAAIGFFRWVQLHLPFSQKARGNKPNATALQEVCEVDFAANPTLDGISAGSTLRVRPHEKSYGELFACMQRNAPRTMEYHLYSPISDSYIVPQN